MCVCLCLSVCACICMYVLINTCILIALQVHQVQIHQQFWWWWTKWYTIQIKLISKLNTRVLQLNVSRTWHILSHLTEHAANWIKTQNTGLLKLSAWWTCMLSFTSNWSVVLDFSINYCHYHIVILAYRNINLYY